MTSDLESQRPLVDIWRGDVTFLHNTLGTLVTRVESLGDLVLSTGNVGACDPFVADLTSAFSRSVAPGTYRVEGAAVQLADGDERLGAARIVFSDAPIVDVEPVTFVGAAPDGIAFGVDSGTGCFFDPAQTVVPPVLDLASDLANRRLLAVLDADQESDECSWVCAPHPDAPSTLIAFSSGFGDGIYSSYWGLDKNAEPVALWTDFGLLHEGIYEGFPVSLPFRRGPISHPMLVESKIRVRAPFFRRRRLVVSGDPNEIAVVRFRSDPGSSARWVGSKWKNDVTQQPTRVCDFEGDGELFLEILVGERPVSEISPDQTDRSGD